MRSIKLKALRFWHSLAINLEAKNPDQILKNFACTRFKAEFPIFYKVDVNGSFTAPVYQFLKSSSGGFLGDLIKWNFEKFLVDKNHSACFEGSWDWLLCSLLSYACKDVAAAGASLALRLVIEFNR